MPIYVQFIYLFIFFVNGKFLNMNVYSADASKWIWRGCCEVSPWVVILILRLAFHLPYLLLITCEKLICLDYLLDVKPNVGWHYLFIYFKSIRASRFLMNSFYIPSNWLIFAHTCLISFVFLVLVCSYAY